MNNLTTFLTAPDRSILGNDLGHYMVFQDKKWSFHSRQGGVPLSSPFLVPHIAIVAMCGDEATSFLPMFGKTTRYVSEGLTELEFLVRCFVPTHEGSDEIIMEDFPFGTFTFATTERAEVLPRLKDWLYNCQNQFTHTTF